MRRGILALSNIATLTLTLLGIFLLIGLGSTLWGWIGPGAEVNPATENSIEELLVYMDAWEKSENNFLTTVIPFDIGEGNGLVFFPSINFDLTDTVADNILQAKRIRKPNVKQCDERACVCVYNLDSCPTSTFSDASVLKCHELTGIDYVASPATVTGFTFIPSPGGPPIPVFTLSDHGNKILKKEAELIGEDSLLLIPQYKGFSYRNMGVQTYSSWYKKIYNDHTSIKAMSIDYSFPVWRHACDGKTISKELYVEKSVFPDGKSILFLTPIIDPAIPFRKSAFNMYVKNNDPII